MHGVEVYENGDLIHSYGDTKDNIYDIDNEIIDPKIYNDYLLDNNIWSAPVAFSSANIPVMAKATNTNTTKLIT